MPRSLHAEFISKLGGHLEHAEQELLEWYPRAAEAFGYTAIGDDDFRFWRARFREWVGTTVAPINGSKRTAEQSSSDADTGDWFAECQRLHQGACNGKLGHRTQMVIDAVRAHT